MIKECTLCWEHKEIPEDSFYSCCKECMAKAEVFGIPTVGLFATYERRVAKRTWDTTIFEVLHCKGCTCK